MGGGDVEATPGRRLPHAFAAQPRDAQLIAAVATPAALGAISGLALGLWGPAYWALQVIATLGGFLAGLEHEGAASGARRGLLGGALFGASLLIVHYVSGLHEHASLGKAPAFLVVITAIVGCSLGALGGRRRARTVGPSAPE